MTQIWWFEPFRVFMDSGGQILWVILFVSIVTWFLIIERWVYMFYIYPVEMSVVIDLWQQRKEFHSWSAHRRREQCISEVAEKLRLHLQLIHSLVAVLPILGLLGTVIGMVQTFDVLAIFGTGNARALAGSISTALVTTMAGLVSSIPCLLVSNLLDGRSEREIEQLSDKLIVQHHGFVVKEALV